MRSIGLVALLAAGLAGCRNEGLTSSMLEIPALASTPASADPALAVLPGSGDLVLAWVAGEGETWTLVSARSTDGGQTWSDATPVAGGASAPGEVHPHGESAPRLVAGPRGMLGMAWPNRIVVPGRKWPAAMMRFVRSADGGRTWSSPITLNDDTTGAPTSHQFHGAAWTGDSGLVVAWLDERGRTEGSSDATIYLASSSNFGASWAPNRPAWGAVCPCCKISLARRANGEVVAAWRKHFSGNVRDVVTAPLTASASASEPRRVHDDNWVYPGCPHTGPSIAAGAGGTAHVVWYTGKAKEGGAGVFYGQIDSSGSPRHRVALLTGARLPPTHAAVTSLDDGGALVAYDLGDDKGARAITVVRMKPDGTAGAPLRIPESAEGKYPQLAVVGDTAALVAWTATEGETSRVRMARVRLGGGR